MSLACIRIGKLLQRVPALQLLSVVHDNLNAKHALAFGINLQSQFTAVQLKNRQIMPSAFAFFGARIYSKKAAGIVDH
jgi:hypothetical protein